MSVFEDKARIARVQVRMSVQYFLMNDPPSPYKGWNLPAFQEYCKREMSQCGFDLDRKIHCNYNKQNGEVVFWQNVLELDLDESIFN